MKWGRFIPTRGLGLKLIGGFTLVFSLAFCILFYLFYLYSTELALGRVAQDLRDTVRGAALSLSADEVRLLAQRGKSDGKGGSSDPLYPRLLNVLEKVHQIEPRAWPYVYVAAPKTGEIRYLADVWSLHNPEKAAKFGETLPGFGSGLEGLKILTVDMPRDQRQGGPFDLQRRVGYSDGYGVWVSAYQPLRGQPLKGTNGQLEGAIGIDFDASYVDQVQDAVLAYTLRAFGIAYLILLLLVYGVSLWLSQPLGRLALMARKVGAGEYNQDFRPLLRRSRDEIVELAEVFQGMVEQVQQREVNLQHQVEELQIQIDHSKREQQVEEIVSSDFFQDIKGKVASMRARATQPSDPSAQKG